MNEKRTPRLNRRRLIQGAVVGAAVPVLPAAARASAAPLTASSATTAKRRAKATDPEFRWFGTSGWRIDFDGRTVLSDPYLTRFDTGMFTGGFNPLTKLSTDTGRITRHAGVPELILVSHSHWDHLNDVPFIAGRSPETRIVGTETTYHLLRALGVDKSKIIVAKGGEVLDFGGYVVEVVASRHSRNKSCGYFAPGTLTAPPVKEEPWTISDLPEGDTLAFQVTIDDGPSAFLMGASDFSERDAAGLRPDIAMIAVPNSTSTHRYVPRLLAALGNPGTVVPVHWDNFETSLENPPRRDPGTGLDDFLAQVRAATPLARILVPEYLTPYRL